jgi:hypothetical protein
MHLNFFFWSTHAGYPFNDTHAGPMPQFENLTFAARGGLSCRENIGEAPKIRADVHLSFNSTTMTYVQGSCAPADVASVVQ